MKLAAEKRQYAGIVKILHAKVKTQIIRTKTENVWNSLISFFFLSKTHSNNTIKNTAAAINIYLFKCCAPLFATARAQSDVSVSCIYQYALVITLLTILVAELEPKKEEL